MTEQPLFVIADNYRLALHYAREHDLGREGGAWRFVREWHQVRGWGPGRFVRVTIGEAPGFVLAEHDAIAEYLRLRGFEELR